MQKKYQRKKISVWFLVFISIVLFGFMLLSFYEAFMKKSALDSELEDMEEKVITLENDNQSLRQMIDYFKSSEFLSLSAKQKLGMKRPDEEVIIIPDQPTVATLDDSSNPPGVSSSEESAFSWKQNPARWWNYFFRVE